MRLDKYICKSTELTRSEAKKCLKKEEVQINGEIVKDPTIKVKDTDSVTLFGRQISSRTFRYIMLHKPLDTICSNIDEVYPSVLNYIDVDHAFDLNIAGRLDADTTGLVLITDDGQWLHNIISPKKSCAKTYRVWLDTPLDESVEAQFQEGVQLHGEKGLTLPASLEVITEKEVLLTITEGKYHQVKRMFAAVDNKVVALHREKIGDISLDDLEETQWRYLTEDEVNSFL